MADRYLDLDREVLLGLLAEKIGCRRRDLSFLFEEKTIDEDVFTMPEFSESVLKPMAEPFYIREDF